MPKDIFIEEHENKFEKAKNILNFDGDSKILLKNDIVLVLKNVLIFFTFT